MAHRQAFGRWLCCAAAALLALWVAWTGRSIWFPVAIAFVISIVLDPTVDRLESWGLGRGPATGIVFLVFLAASLSMVLAPLVSAQAGAIARDLDRSGRWWTVRTGYIGNTLDRVHG